MASIPTPFATPEERLATFFDTSAPRATFDDHDIDEVGLLLEQCGHIAYTCPRTYILFRTIGQLHMLEQLVRVGFGDQWFPVDSRRLPNFLEPSIKSAVVQQQGIILTKSLDLENGRHCHFKPGEALPFDVLGRLGSGGSGQVDRIKSKISFREYALKRIRRRAAFGTASSQEVVKGFLNEMRIIKRLEHRHIVRYVGSYTEKSFLGLVMTPVADGDLAAYIEHLCGCLQSSSIQPQATAEMSSDLRMYFGCLSAALAYLHNQKIRHKDIKPQNILISNGNVLFADFGISHDFTDDVGSTTSGLTPAAPRYAAPEVIAYEARNNSSDIWSLGCVFLEMAAALRALDVEWIKNYFGERGSRNFHYHSNFAAIAELVENFKTIGTRKDRPVLIWIQKMLLMEHRARPTATRLLEMITLPDAAEPNLPTSIFCGICCIPDLDSDSESDLVDSPVESTQNIPQAGVVSTGKIQRDHNTQQDDDRLSIQSIKSSTTLLSTLSGLTTVEKSATVELESVFQEDVELIGLYRLALKDETLEPDRLQRNIARLLQLFAKDLRREAGTHLERVVSRFVQSKARYVAQCIVEKFHDTPKTPHRLHVRIEQGGSDIGDVKQKEDPYEIAEAQPEFNEYQFEAHDMDEVAPVDEDYFEDLAVLRTFLARSSAFQIFRARLTKFVLPRDWHQLDIDSAVRGRHNEAPLSRFCRFSVLAGRIFKAVLVAVGCLEPPLQPGLIRLRWQCDCGAPLFGDVQEYRIGGVSRLIEQMERSTGGKVTATFYDEQSSRERYIPGPIIWVRETARSFARAFSKDANRNDILLPHRGPGTTLTPASVNIELPPVRNLLLLACVHQSQGGQSLRQDSIGTIENDRQLFCFIRQQLSHTLNARWPFLWLKTVMGIHFTQFHLRLNDDVEPRLHKLCCKQSSCQCVPLTSNDEYDCEPAGPLDFGPPVLPSQMLHYFKHPELIAEKEMSILNQLPKRNCGKMQPTGQMPARGWGLYYEEGWNIGLIIGVIVGITISAGLLFGIYWTIAKTDIQGAWGVSSYMVTSCALVVALLSTISRAKGE